MTSPLLSPESANGRTLCIYCQVAEAVTDDHVPPQCLFGKPRPLGLIAVPACEACNLGASKDDEYFKWYMASRASNETNPIAQRLRPDVIRSLSLPGAEGFAAMLARNMRIVEDPDSPEGYKRQAFVDFERIGEVAKRTVRGLHYSKYGSPLRPDCPLICYADGAFTPTGPADGNRMAGFMADLTEAPLVTVVPDAFSYRHYTFENDERSVWLLTFFGGSWLIVFVGIEPPPDDTGDATHN
jgi:hypothetical protein